MKIKTKLTLAVGFLFSLIILLSVIGVQQINRLAADTNNILVANYNTLHYSRNMLLALDHLSGNEFRDKFGENLKLQLKNITEPGEEQSTKHLDSLFNSYCNGIDTAGIAIRIRGDIYDIMKLNMDAIQRKSQIAGDTAHKAIIWIVITGTICFLFAFSLLINLPGNIANPISELSKSIREIANKNYSSRVNIGDNSEFKELSKSFNVMAEKLEEYNNSNLSKLMMEKKRIEELINNMKDPIIGIDENKKIIFINEEALTISGLKREGVVGSTSTEIAKRNDLIKSLVSEPASPQPTSPMKIYANGKESYFEKESLSISMIPTAEVNPVNIGKVIILRNVTTYKELDYAKTNFIATVSHELKTPISSIRMSLQLLFNEKTGRLNTEQRNLLDSINDDTDRLLKITAELLNMTQVESGKIQLGIMPVDPSEILAYAISATKNQAEAKNIELINITPGNLPRVLADSEKLAWVITNLISNAIRYSYENASVRLSVYENENEVCFSVKDTGQGIAPEYKEKIFDRYFRIPGTQREGTGLGLSISKEFVEALGGKISVESELGVGSEFIVSLRKDKRV